MPTNSHNLNVGDIKKFCHSTISHQHHLIGKDSDSHAKKPTKWGIKITSTVANYCNAIYLLMVWDSLRFGVD